MKLKKVNKMKMRYSAVQWMVGFEVVKKSINRPWGESPTSTVYLTPNQFHFSKNERLKVNSQRKQFDPKILKIKMVGKTVAKANTLCPEKLIIICMGVS